MLIFCITIAKRKWEGKFSLRSLGMCINFFISSAFDKTKAQPSGMIHQETHCKLTACQKITVPLNVFHRNTQLHQALLTKAGK